MTGAARRRGGRGTGLPRAAGPSPGGRHPGFHSRYGPWALVVGGSEGLGASFAEALAIRGLDLILVARRRRPLDELANRLHRAHGVAVRTLAVDAAAAGGLAAIARATRALDVGLVVCNAALAPVAPFLDLPAAQLDRMIDLNCRTAARLAHALGRRMASRGRGGIVLLSSMAGFQGTALVAHYAATKAYLRVLAEGLWDELRPRGVDVIACCAGRVRTPTWERSGPRAESVLAPPVMEADPVVEATLAALGRQPVVIPGRLNRLVAGALRLLPRRTAVALVSAATRALYPSARAGSHRRARRGAPGPSGPSRPG